MNMKKALPLFVIASLMLTIVPSVFASPTLSLSVSVGPVETQVVVSGTIDTYNGGYEIYFDIDGNGAHVLAERVATGTATGYAFSKTIKIPNTTAGAKRIWIHDLSSLLDSAAFFTVQSKWYLKTTQATQHEGGPINFNVTITGADAAWATVIDLRVRIVDPSATQFNSTVYANVPATATPGKLTVLNFLGVNAPSVNLVTWGTYNIYVDWDIAAPPTWPTAQQGVVSTTFEIRMTDKLTYKRTDPIKVRIYVPATWAGALADKVVIYYPDGSVAQTFDFAPNVAAGNFIPIQTWNTVLTNEALGTYTVKVLDAAATPVAIKTSTFVMTPAAISITLPAAADFQESWTLGAAGSPQNIVGGQQVERMHTVSAKFTLKYPDGSIVQGANLPAGVDVKVAYNGTVVTTVHLDPLTNYIGTQWVASWKVPKDAKKGINYEFNVTASSITDTYGNSGPTKTFSTRSVAKFEVIKGFLFVQTAPTLSFPAAGNTLQRTLEAKANIDIRYADNSRFMGTDMKWLNVTASNGAAYNKVINVAAADYNADAGIWVAQLKVPYNAPISPPAPALPDFHFDIAANDIEDIYGNGANALANGVGAFYVGKATITISNVKTNAATYETDQQLTVTFDAKYPSGDLVTKRTDLSPTATREYPIVTIYDSAGTAVAVLRAGYVGGKWTASWVIAAGVISGTYNATIDVFSDTLGAEKGFADDADAALVLNCNTGPTVKQYANFEISRVSLTDVLAATTAAEAAAELAQAKADAAKTAADTAGTKADAAKTAATAAQTAATAAQTAATAAQTAATTAGTKADSALTAAQAATTAAQGAKTSADSATTAAVAAKTSADATRAAVDGLTIMVYVAIAASTLALCQGAGQCLNQYADAELDKQIKPYRPIPSGLVSREEALGLSWLLAIFSMGRAFTIGEFFGLMVLVILFFSVFYSLAPFSPRKLDPIVNTAWMAVSRGFVPMYAVWSIYGDTGIGLRYALLALLWVMGFQATKDVSDVEGDLRFGIKTIPNTYGLSGLIFTMGVCTTVYTIIVAYFELYPMLLVLPLAAVAMFTTNKKSGLTENTYSWTVIAPMPTKMKMNQTMAGP